MKTWIVRAESITHYEAKIQAETQEEAWNLAHELDGGNFDLLGECDWKVFDVYPEDE